MSVDSPLQRNAVCAIWPRGNEDGPKAAPPPSLALSVADPSADLTSPAVVVEWRLGLAAGGLPACTSFDVDGGVGVASSAFVSALPGAAADAVPSRSSSPFSLAWLSTSWSLRGDGVGNCAVWHRFFLT